MSIDLLTFDIFGTVVDWRAGLERDLGREDVKLTPALFERIVDDQGRSEKGHYFEKYTSIAAWSLTRSLGLHSWQAIPLARRLGEWPLFPDAKEALRQLLAKVPCVAMTNSDRSHGEQVQNQLGFRLSDWVCAEELGVYKPDPAFWHAVAKKRGIQPGPSWWHVSAYADYDLAAAKSLGLTTVLVQRPHHRPGPADIVVPDLQRLFEAV